MKTKNKQLVLITSFLALLLTVFIFFNLSEKQAVTHSSSQLCDLSVQNCQQTINKTAASYTIKINQKPIEIETLNEIIMTFDAPFNEEIHDKLQIEGKIEGLNMQMGFIPVNFKHDQIKSVWRGTFMLGACIEPEMTWLLTINLDFSKPVFVQQNTDTLTAKTDSTMQDMYQQQTYLYVFKTEM